MLSLSLSENLLLGSFLLLHLDVIVVEKFSAVKFVNFWVKRQKYSGLWAIPSNQYSKKNRFVFALNISRILSAFLALPRKIIAVSRILPAFLPLKNENFLKRFTSAKVTLRGSWQTSHIFFHF
jgi:hypothetical protein